MVTMTPRDKGCCANLGDRMVKREGVESLCLVTRKIISRRNLDPVQWIDCLLRKLLLGS